MSDLPAGWATAVLGELALDVTSGFASGRHNSEAVGVPHLRPMNVSRDGRIDLEQVKYVAAEVNDRRLHVGDLLFNNTNSPELVGKTALFSLDGDYAFSNHMTRVRLRSQLSAPFFAHQLHSRWVLGELQHLISNHVNQASISRTRLASDVPLVVAPTAEQERIVTAIEEAFSKLDAGEAGLRTVRQRMQSMRESVLTAAVSGELVAGTDEEWKTVHLHEILATPLANGRSVRTQEGGFPVLRLTCLRDGQVDLTERKEGEWSADDAEPFLVEKDDFLVSRGNGSLRLVGRGALVVVEPDPVAYPDTLIRVRARRDEVDPRLLALWWNAPPVRRQLESRARTTAGIYKVNQSMLSEVALTLPPREQQEDVVAEVERQMSFIEACEGAVDVGLTKAAALRRSVLKVAFEGKLVPQDPADEPASVLLERIRAERAGGSG